MDSRQEDTPQSATRFARMLGRALQVWAIGGVTLFAPGGLFLMVFGLAAMGVMGFVLLLPVGCTLFGAYLFCQAGAALRRGAPARGQIVVAVLATWNVIVVFSAFVLWDVGKMAITDWSRFVAEYSRISAFDGYFLAGAALHVLVNTSVLIAAAFLRTRAASPAYA